MRSAAGGQGTSRAGRPSPRAMRRTSSGGRDLAIVAHEKGLARRAFVRERDLDEVEEIVEEHEAAAIGDAGERQR